MSGGLVYIMTNPCLDGWVKIGMTERNDIDQHLNELNSPSNIPLSYRCYAVYEVENPLEVEKRIHNIIDLIDSSLHAREVLTNGRIRERIFQNFSRNGVQRFQKYSRAARRHGQIKAPCPHRSASAGGRNRGQQKQAFEIFL